MVLAQDELGVDQDVAAEDERSQAAVDELAEAAGGQKHGHEAEEQQPPQGAEQVGHPAGEVVLGLAGEQGQEDEDAAGQDDGVEHDGGAVEGHDDADGVGLEQREPGQEEQVRRVRLALPVREAHEDEGAEELHVSSTLVSYTM